MAKHNGSNAEEKLDQLGEEASQLADKAAKGADQLADEANAQLSAANAAAGDVASGLQKQARQVVSEAGKKAQELTTDGVEKGKEAIDDTAAAAGGLLRESASTLRDIAPKSGVAGDVARQVAGALDEGGRQLQSGRSQGLIEQVRSWVSRHPVLSTLIVLGLLGWIFGGRRR